MSKNFWTWVIIITVLLAVAHIFSTPIDSIQKDNPSFSGFMDQVSQGQVENVIIRGQKIAVHTKDEKSYVLYVPSGDATLIPLLREKNVDIVVLPTAAEEGSFWDSFLSWLPILFFVGAWIFFMRQMQSGNGKAMSFGKSRARLHESKKRITFDDVAGIDEAKEELTEIVEYLREPQKFQRLGGKIPKGVLLIGPPGTGKTLLAKAIAGEADVPFFTISGSDFVEMFVGVGASRVRDMFEQAKKSAPCLVFIDEIDAVGRHRGAGLGGGNDEREQTLNQLLVEMDGFDTNEGVILIAATNRPDVLDPALLRPGRFDRQVTVPNPDIAGREKILQVHAKKIPMAPDVDLRIVARGTPGFSGADLANIVNEAALLAARKSRRLVTMDDFEQARDKVMMGPERRSMVMDDDEKKMTAYHEGGHAVCSLHCPGSHPIHKATIIPRGQALGLVAYLPEKDQHSTTREQFKARLCSAFGGRVAEELVFGYDKVSSGASQDILQATRIARAMVTNLGMSDALGPIAYEEPSGEVFLGYAVTQKKNISEETARKIDAEIKALIDEAYGLAKKILTDNRHELDNLAKALLEYETLTLDEVKKAMEGEKIERVDRVAASARSSVPMSEE